MVDVSLNPGRCLFLVPFFESSVCGLMCSGAGVFIGRWSGHSTLAGTHFEAARARDCSARRTGTIHPPIFYIFFTSFLTHF